MENKLGPALFIGIGVIIVALTMTGKLQNLLTAANSGVPLGGSPSNNPPQQQPVTKLSGEKTTGTNTAMATASYLPGVTDANAAYNAVLQQIAQSYLAKIGVPNANGIDNG